MGLQLRGNTSVTGTAGAHQEFNFLSTHLPRCPGGLSCLLRIHPKQYFISPFQAHDPVLGTEGNHGLSYAILTFAAPLWRPGLLLPSGLLSDVPWMHLSLPALLTFCWQFPQPTKHSVLYLHLRKTPPVFRTQPGTAPVKLSALC